ncbi:MAG: erythromycin esterase family protein [Planctomycetota bacterium]
MDRIEFSSTDPANRDDDLRPFLDRVGGARVVGLGDPTTGSREALRLKHRLVALLARELDFSAVVLEANLADVIRVNEYALEGRGDPPVLLRRHLPRRLRTREMADLVTWMWDYNMLTSTRGRIALAGCDMQRIETAAEIVVETVRGLDPGFASTVEKKYEVVLEANRARWLSGAGIQAWFPVEEARGRRIRFSGHIRTEAVSDHACIWCWAGGPDGTLAHDALVGRRPRGTSAWREYAIDLDVPEEATHLGLGCFLAGRGRAWFDGLAVTLDGETWQDPSRIDLGLASDALTGFWVDPRTRAVPDGEVRRSDRPALRVESSGAIPSCETSHLEAHALAEQVLSDLMSRWSASQAGRALRCALSVVQALEMRTGGGDASRARSMAENIEWLLARNPEARVVYWAGNDAVARGGMDTGGFLAKNLGGNYVPVGFATGSGAVLAPSPRWREVPVSRPLAVPPEGSAEDGLAGSGGPPAILDLRTLDARDPDWGWLTNRRPFRTTDDPAAFTDRRLPDDFDLLVWQPETTAATPV